MLSKTNKYISRLEKPTTKEQSILSSQNWTKMINKWARWSICVQLCWIHYKCDRRRTLTLQAILDRKLNSFKRSVSLFFCVASGPYSLNYAILFRAFQIDLHFFRLCSFRFFPSFARSSFYSAKWAGRASVQCANERINKRTNKRNKLPHLYSAKQTLLCIILILCWSWIFFGDVSLFCSCCCCTFTPVFLFFSFLIGIVVSIPIWFNKLSLLLCFSLTRSLVVCAARVYVSIRTSTSVHARTLYIYYHNG